MTRKQFLRLAAGFRRFRKRYFEPEKSIYKNLQKAQQPKTLVIACSDSRVDPAIISTAAPGELFVVRNVANMVPPFQKPDGHHGVSAAIEFAVNFLKIENIVILGHEHCGGIQALVQGLDSVESGFLTAWVSMARPALERVKKEFPNSDEATVCRKCERESIKNSITNLRTFPFVNKAIKAGQLQIFGAYFELSTCRIYFVEDGKENFTPIKL